MANTSFANDMSRHNQLSKLHPPIQFLDPLVQTKSPKGHQKGLIYVIIPSPTNHYALSRPKLGFDFEKNFQHIYGYASNFSLRLASILNGLCVSVNWRWYKSFLLRILATEQVFQILNRSTRVFLGKPNSATAVSA